jgi:hypothetical protein
MWFGVLFPPQKTINKMSLTFRSRQISFLTQCGLFAIALYSIHSYLLHYFAAKTMFLFPLWHIYIFNFATTALLYTIINHKYSKGKDTVFNWLSFFYHHF